MKSGAGPEFVILQYFCVVWTLSVGRRHFLQIEVLAIGHFCRLPIWPRVFLRAFERRRSVCVQRQINVLFPPTLLPLKILKCKMFKQLERCKNPKREEVKCGRKGEKLDIPLPHLGGTWEGRLAGDFCSAAGGSSWPAPEQMSMNTASRHRRCCKMTQMAQFSDAEVWIS